jgi:hypothetical protein
MVSIAVLNEGNSDISSLVVGDWCLESKRQIRGARAFGPEPSGRV